MSFLRYFFLAFLGIIKSEAATAAAAFTTIFSEAMGFVVLFDECFAPQLMPLPRTSDIRLNFNFIEEA